MLRSIKRKRPRKIEIFFVTTNVILFLRNKMTLVMLKQFVGYSKFIGGLMPRIVLQKKQRAVS